MHRQIPLIYSSFSDGTQSCSYDQRDQKELIECVRRVAKILLPSIELTKDNVARSIPFIRFHVTQFGKDGAEQSIKSILRTTRHLVYKRRSKRVPETTAESVPVT